MNSYEAEIYHYFTEESNFRNMAKVANHATNIKAELLKEFWDALLKSLNEKNANSGKKWIVSSHGTTTDIRGKILIHNSLHQLGKNGLPIVAVGIQRIMDKQYPFYGVFLNNHAEGYDASILLNNIRNLPEIKEFKEDNDIWWPRWMPTGLDFKNDEDYVKILPHNRQVTVDSISDSIFDLLRITEDNLNNIYDMKKNRGHLTSI